MAEKLDADVARAQTRAPRKPSDADLADTTAVARQKAAGS
jgi:hypothetical protein